MHKHIIVLTVLVLMAALASPAMAAGPDMALTIAPTTTLTTTATLTATATVAPTFTPQATYTPFPTFTPLPTYTPLPTFTPLPQPTSAPVVQPTAAPEAKPTLAPTPESESGLEVGDGDGKLVFGGSYTLRSGERLRGDLVVFGGNARLEADTSVDGNVAVIGGETDIAGRVRGDMVIVGGSVRLRSSAEVDGQLVRVGGTLEKDEGAKIHGGESGGADIPPIPPIPTRPPVESWPQTGVNVFLRFVANVVYSIGMTVVLALLAVFVVALWREPLGRVSQTIVNAPAASWGVGTLTVLAFVVVLPAFAVLSAILIIACGLGLLGFGAIAAASVALVIGWLMGWIALGQIVGQRLLDALGDHHPTLAISAAVGTAALTLFWLGLAPLCGMGWLIFAVLSPLGLGAVVLTRFGTQDYRTSNGAYPAAWSPAPAPVAPAAPVTPVTPEPPAAPVPPVAPEPPQFMPSAPEAAPSSEPPAKE